MYWGEFVFDDNNSNQNQNQNAKVNYRVKGSYLNHRDKIDLIARDNILDLLADNPCYGYRRVAIYFNWSDNRARRIMRKFNIYPKYKKPRYLVKKDDLQKPSQSDKIPNLLKPITENKKLLRPNQVWSADFTYLRFRSSFLYLSTIIDTYSKDILGYHISNRHNQDLVNTALNMAIRRNNYISPDIFHSDQGSEYTSYEYQKLLETNNIKISLSKKSSPWENGYQESFYGKFKFELGSTNRFKRVEDLIETVYKQIYYYNNQRIHTSIRDIPARFKQKYYDNLILKE